MDRRRGRAYPRGNRSAASLDHGNSSQSLTAIVSSMPTASLAHVYGQPPDAVAFSDQRLTDDEAEKIARLIVRLPELVELEQDRNEGKSRRRWTPPSRPVSVGDLARDGKFLEVECSACRPSPGTSISSHCRSNCRSGCRCRMWPTISSAASVAPGTTNSSGQYARDLMREIQG